MRIVERVDMANSDEIYEIKLGEEVIVKKEDDGFTVFEGPEEHSTYRYEQDAIAAAHEVALDPDLIVTGWGSQSGRKIWQLPSHLLDKIKQKASIPTEARSS